MKNERLLQQEKQEREEEERKRRIQLYVFVSRCISYPFNAKQPTDMTRRQIKITKHQLETITSRFQVSDLDYIRILRRDTCGLSGLQCWHLMVNCAWLIFFHDAIGLPQR